MGKFGPSPRLYFVIFAIEGSPPDKGIVKSKSGVFSYMLEEMIIKIKFLG